MHSSARSTFISGALVASIAVMLVTVSASPDREWTLTIEPVTSAAAKERWAHGGVGQAMLKMSERTPTGWSSPRSVVSGADLVVNAADVPSVMALADGSLAAAWIQENGPDPEAYNLKVAWSKDGGANWSAPASRHQI